VKAPIVFRRSDAELTVALCSGARFYSSSATEASVAAALLFSA
jgi:hypothetical protein